MSRGSRVIQRQLIDEALDCAGLYEVDVRTDYSGRGMSGATCLGIVCDSERSAFRLFAALGQISGERTIEDENWEPEIVSDLAASALTDSMGRSLVVYFPRWEVAE